MAKRQIWRQKIEESFQNIRDVGDPKLLREMWDEAKKVAEQKSTNTTSTFDSIKQLLAP